MLPRVTDEWWRECVLENLSHSQREIALDNDYDKLEQFDLAALLRIADKSWYDMRSFAYLQEMEIPYIFAGETEIDVELALHTLAVHGINTLLLEGGSIVNGYFQRAGVIDELSLVVTPVIADAEDKPLFMNSTIADFELKEVKQYDSGVIWLNYTRKR